jgi:hypothetical protein
MQGIWCLLQLEERVWLFRECGQEASPGCRGVMWSVWRLALRLLIRGLLLCLSSCHCQHVQHLVSREWVTDRLVVRDTQHSRLSLPVGDSEGQPVWGAVDDGFQSSFHQWLEGGVRVEAVFCPIMQHHTLPYSYWPQVHPVLKEKVVGVVSTVGDDMGDRQEGERAKVCVSMVVAGDAVSHDARD